MRASHICTYVRIRHTHTYRSAAQLCLNSGVRSQNAETGKNDFPRFRELVPVAAAKNLFCEDSITPPLRVTWAFSIGTANDTPWFP